MVDRAFPIVNRERKFLGQPVMRAAIQLRTGKLDTSRGFLAWSGKH